MPDITTLPDASKFGWDSAAATRGNQQPQRVNVSNGYLEGRIVDFDTGHVYTYHVLNDGGVLISPPGATVGSHFSASQLAALAVAITRSREGR